MTRRGFLGTIVGAVAGALVGRKPVTRWVRHYNLRTEAPLMRVTPEMRQALVKSTESLFNPPSTLRAAYLQSQMNDALSRMNELIALTPKAPMVVMNDADVFNWEPKPGLTIPRLPCFPSVMQSPYVPRGQAFVINRDWADNKRVMAEGSCF